MEGENWKITHPLKTFYHGNKKPMGGGSDPHAPLVYATVCALIVCTDT